MSTLLKIEFTLADDLADEAGEFIFSKVPHGWEETPVDDGRRFTIYIEDHPLGEQVAKELQAHFVDVEIVCAEEEPEDWAMAWKDFFNPVNCGETFKIFPPWLDENAQNGTTHITIEPKMAFGTGHHPTTSLCLATIGTLAKDSTIGAGQTFLDLGTGSGILAIGLGKLGLTGVGLDIDPLAIPCAVENAEINDVADNIELAVGTIDCLDDDVQFNLIVANILSGPLIEIAPDILPHIAAGGSLVLSGILANKQADAVARAYEKRGIGQPERFVEGEWVCLVWKNIEI